MARLASQAYSPRSVREFCANARGAQLGCAKKDETPPRRGLDALCRYVTLHGGLQVLGGAERHLLAGLDLDGLAGGGVAAHARGTLAHLQDAQAVELDALALLQVLGDDRD